MKFKLKKAIGLSAVALILLFLTLPFNSYAANTLLSVSKQDIKAGDSFDVTISGAKSSNLSLHYDGTMVTLKGQGNATLNGNTLSVSGRSATFTFEAKKAGNAGFVASSDRYARSSVMLSIGEAAAASETTENEVAETKKDSRTEKNTNANKKTQDADTVASEEKNTDETAEAQNALDESDNSVQDNAKPQENTAFSSSNLTFKQLILDRRVMLIIAVLVAIIIILVIRLIWLHFEDYDDEEYEEDIKTRIETSPVNEKPTKKQAQKEADEDNLYEKLKAEEKLTMPKAPAVSEKKLHLEDLNNL